MSRAADHIVWRGSSLSVCVLFSAAGVGQQIWIESGMRALLVDVGDGALRDMLQNGLSPNSLEGLVITHGHFDHVGGLHALLGFLRMIDRSERLVIAAPTDCTELLSIVDGFHNCYRESLPFDVSIEGLGHGDKLNIGPFAVEAHPVVHCGSTATVNVGAQVPANGYRISHEGETVAITGDTGTDADLSGLVSGTDLALIEATYGPEAEPPEESLRKVHLSEHEAEKLGKLAGEYRLVHRGRRRQI